MIFNKLAASIAALGLVVLPVAAQANDAQRASKPAASKSHFDANSIYLLAAIGAIVVGIFVVANEDDSTPASM